MHDGYDEYKRATEHVNDQARAIFANGHRPDEPTPDRPSDEWLMDSVLAMRNSLAEARAINGDTVDPENFMIPTAQVLVANLVVLMEELVEHRLARSLDITPGSEGDGRFGQYL